MLTQKKYMTQVEGQKVFCRSDPVIFKIKQSVLFTQIIEKRAQNDKKFTAVNENIPGV